MIVIQLLCPTLPKPVNVTAPDAASVVNDPAPPLPPNGPTVAPFTRAYTPAEVVHISPFAGVVGAEPGGIFIGAFATVDVSVTSLLVNVPPVKLPPPPVPEAAAIA